MDLDGGLDDFPPLLVAVDDPTLNVPEQLDVAFEDLNIVKVPITIVTGRLHVQILSFWFMLLILILQLFMFLDFTSSLIRTFERTYTPHSPTEGYFLSAEHQSSHKI